MNNKTKLVIVRNPFDRANRDEVVLHPNGPLTVQSIMSANLPASADTELTVTLNGKIIPQDEWQLHTVIEGDCVVVVPVVRNDNATLSTILMVALIVVVNIYAPGITAAYGAAAGSLFTVGSIMLGSALISAMLPPDKPQLPSLGAGSSNTSNAYSWSPATTQQPGGVVVRAYGKNKLYGNIIAGYITSTGNTGQEQVAHLLIDLGCGPYQSLYDFKLNDQPIGNYSGVTVMARMGHVNQSIIPAFNDTYMTHAIGAKVVAGSPVVRDTVGSDYDALEITLICPGGLWYANDAGGLDRVNVYLAVEISSDGGATWHHVAMESRTSITISPGRWSLGYWKKVRDDFQAERHWIEKAVGSTVRSDHVEGAIDYSVSGYPRSVWHWLDIPTKVSTTVTDSITISGASQQPIRRKLRVDNLVRGTRYKVRCTNLSADQTTTRWSDDVYLGELNEVIYDDFQYPRTVLVGIDALATSQISGSIKFSCLAECAIVRVWNGAAWASQYSNNPAWVCWDILTQPVLNNDLSIARYDGLDPSRLDLAAFKRWADFCDVQVPNGAGGYEARCTFDGLFDTLTSMWDAALEVCSSARAQLMMRGTTVTVVFDDVRALPAQLFTVANTSVSSFKETFLPMQDRAASIEVGFVDGANDYVRDSITVVNTAITESTAQRTQISLRGVTRASQAYREANYRLKRNELLKRTASISVDIDSLACTVGDLIWLQDDVTRWGIGGRAVSGSTTTRLMLDQQVELLAGITYELKLRLADDTLVSRTVTTAAGVVSALDVSVAFPSAPALFDVWALGESGKAIKEFLVIDISRDSEQRAKLSLIEYNASLYGIDAGNPVINTPDLSSKAPLPSVINVRINEVMDLNSSGVVVVHLDIYFDMFNAKKVDIYEGSQRIGESNSGVFRRLNVSSGTAYQYTIRPVNSIGISPASSWVSKNHTVAGLLKNPADIAGFTVHSGASQDVLSWAKSTELDVLNGGSILVRHSPWKTGAVWESSTSACYPLPGNATTVSIPLREGTYFVKAEDSGGRQSKNAASFVNNGVTQFTYTPPATVQDLLQEDPAFPGVFINTYNDRDYGSVIELTGSSLIDDWADFDSIYSIDYAGGVIPSGQYIFGSSLDFGSVKSTRLTAIISSIAENVLNDFDEIVDLDSVLDFDGASGAPVDAWVEVRFTSDDPLTSPSWSEWSRFTSSNFTARAYQFRAQLVSNDPTYDIIINQLRVKVESI